MEEIKKKYDIGCIIGRFQVHKIHDGQREMIEHVLDSHDKVVLFLGTSSVSGTRKNPLDFLSRKKMMEELYGDRISVILPLNDMKDDQQWSVQVDTKIREVVPMGSVVLYGSRDSFIPFYHGKFDTIELVPSKIISGTEIRNDIKNRVNKSEEFRAGAIYSAHNTYPHVYPTVDIAILNEDESEVLLGRKPYEKKYRFIGGFVDVTDDSYEAAAKREVMEETGLEVDNLKYITSMRVDDWRYRGIEDRSIITHFYTAKRIFGTPKANDDIVDVKWRKLRDLDESNLVGEHIKLLKVLIPES